MTKVNAGRGVTRKSDDENPDGEDEEEGDWEDEKYDDASSEENPEEEVVAGPKKRGEE